MRKKLWILLFVVSLAAVLLTVTVCAADVSDLTYEITEGEVIITDCNEDASGKLTIPSTIEGKPVTSIGNYAFSSCRSLTSVTIPDSVTSIGTCAFYNCSSLTSVNIPNSVNSIGDAAFENCTSLESVTIPSGVTIIGYELFRYCTSLSSVTIPDGVTSIEMYAFYNCSSLKSAPIPKSVTSIKQEAFSGCSSLKDVTIPNNVKEIATGAFYGCSSLTSIVIPDNIVSIEAGVFGGCSSLTSVKIPDSVTSIGNYAFSRCDSLRSVTIPDNVTSIGADAFRGCSSLSSVTIPDGVTSIKNESFSGCSNLTEVSISDNVTSINERAFQNCSSLISVTIPDSVTSVDGEAFSGCTSLKNIKIPDGVIKIDAGTFHGCSSLEHIAIPDRVTNIDYRAFEDCSSLTSVTIPNSVTSIDYYAFNNCSNLTDVYYTGTKDQWNAIDIRSNNDPLESATIHYHYVAAAIKTQPKSTTISGSGTATFKVAATGDGLKYQWQFKKSDGSWTNCTSKTTGYNKATLKVEGVTGSTNRNGYQYRCKVTDSAGNTVTSSAATLTVKVLKITTQPKAASVKTTAYATFTVKATGDGIKYQWQYKKPDGSWTNCTSATTGYNTATLKVQGVTGSTNRNGYQYRCKVTDSAGSTVTSSAAKLSVLAITTQPKAATVSKTGTATFKVMATGSSLKYQWQFKTPSGDWKNCTSATTGYNTATLNVKGASGSTNRNGYQYRCVITDGAGNKLTSSAVKLTVK